MTTDDLITQGPLSCGTAQDRVDPTDDDLDCLDWFSCTRALPAELVERTIRTGSPTG